MDRPKKPSALSSTPGLAPQPVVNTTHSNSRVTAILPTGESVEVLLYGATVTSWKIRNGEERLWVSEAAKFDGTKPLRGGIPIVFPVFGQSSDHPATDALPQHGFARRSRWEFLGKSTSESSAAKSNAAGDSAVKLDFGLSPSNLDESTKKLWPHNFGLIYSVTLSREGLETNMVVRNEGQESWEFQYLMHTYFRVDDIANVTVSGLKDSKFLDKVDGYKIKTETASTVKVASEVDRVYTTSGDPSSPLTVSENGKEKLVIVRDNLENVVVWNPWIEKSGGMADFAPKDGYRRMICVEAGQVEGWQKLEPGETFEGGHLIKSSL